MHRSARKAVLRCIIGESCLVTRLTLAIAMAWYVDGHGAGKDQDGGLKQKGWRMSPAVILFSKARYGVTVSVPFATDTA